ncbi:UbiD family decarboxylase [Flavilitoribacter nigricans]|uniref:3-octaprenyl-4-hydroxybenzoate carboxy-lyase n=1 Tax=Flavilitoribacter nigricans (strain ATCC 23147 / DSM 23189 / NBRC 102662 / NCIMB 1420 / SS-2) TaxID=1122177 RepID=A0A2D0NJ03_FLAN2|nr:UbiD family decarboxylase [Flavilitoribacter nigricans]PHN08370.1 3-octaprenyl-4-hydroxybenzoate carboxy-lyase [Flavilitoribacter nigricans DSM 23189 = NBRC 102662]
MSYRSLSDCVKDLERNGHLIRIRSEVDPDLEVAEIHRRVYDKGGPAILFEKIKGSPFPGLSNLYGTFERTDFIFRKTFDKVQKVIELKADPTNFLRNPLRYLSAPFTALTALPAKSWGKAPVTYGRTTIDQLPQIKSWPMDGGAFVTLPQVFTLPPGSRKIMESNLGMYRIQLSGNEYIPNEEIGLHYQIHRGIGIHHTQYNQSDEPFRCSIFVGGPPAHAFCAIMPLPEGLSELTFAGMLAGRRFRYKEENGHYLSSDADFVITGTIRKHAKKPEGPFGDHLGYYSLEHDFPVMEVENVYYRKDAIWHFTVVGRPPQEDSSFGYMIHKLVKQLTPQEFPGIRSINAVDAAGVHPLLLAIGSERYMPFREKQPEEILTQANRILGSGQTSLAKFLIIAADEDDPQLTTHRIDDFFRHVLERVDWTRDLHFYTKTTIDTLDYSGSGWNAGSKVVIACRGEARRKLRHELPTNFSLPDRFAEPRFAQPGILAIRSPKFTGADSYADGRELAHHLERYDLEDIPLILMVDDAEFVSANLNNFLWVTFTRANPSHDLHGVRAFTEFKHWGCRGPLIIDARIKPHHAPPLVSDPAVVKKVDKLFSKGGELAHI